MNESSHKSFLKDCKAAIKELIQVDDILKDISTSFLPTSEEVCDQYPLTYSFSDILHLL